MTVSLLGMELAEAQRLLTALNIKFEVEYYKAIKPLENTDSVRVIRQTEDKGRIVLLASAFKTKADGN